MDLYIVEDLKDFNCNDMKVCVTDGFDVSGYGRMEDFSSYYFENALSNGFIR